MIFKHSMKSIIRTPKKTMLFLFLLIVLTISLRIGVGMYDSARNMLLDADETFTSIVELEYRGEKVGEEVEFYSNMNSDLADFSFQKLENHKSVKSVNMEKTAWAFAEGGTIKQNETPLFRYIMVKIDSIIRNNDDQFMGIVRENLFGRKVREEAYMLLNDIDEKEVRMNYSFISDHEYLVIGRIMNGRGPTLNVSPGLPESVEDIPFIVDLTENPDFFQSEDGKKILALQKAMAVVDNSLQVTAVSSLEASAPYYFNELLLKEGRIFSPSEYEEGKNDVILISEATSDLYQVGVGDVLPLKLHYNVNGVGLSDYLTNTKFAYEANFTVVGIFENKTDNKYMIYLPDAKWLEQKLHSTTLARYIVKNGTGAKFIEDNQNSLLPNMVFTLYDQGYDEAVRPIIALKNSAIMIIILGSLSGIAILFLFSYLIVIKQKDTLKTMLSLGSGKRRTMNYILYGSMALVFVASSLGAIISSGFVNQITGKILETMQNTYGTDIRYSERSIGLQMEFIPQIRVNLWLPTFIVIGILLISFLLLFAFTYSVLLEEKQASSLRKEKKKEKEKVLLPRKTKVNKMMFGRVRPITLKFALISLTRSPGRSFIIPIISLILSFFIIFLGLLSSMQKEKLETVYDRIPVTAYLTSINNETRAMGGLKLQNDIYRMIDEDYSYRLEERDVFADLMDNGRYTSLRAVEEREKLLADSEFFEDMSLYKPIHYEFMGISMTKEGEENEELSRLPEVRKHNNNFGFDWFLNKINQMPRLAYADDIRYTPDFYNESAPKVEFLEGYGYDSLRHNEDIAYISQSVASAYGIENGDTIRVTGWFSYDETAICSVLDLKVVGIYDVKWRMETIYIPWVMSYDHNYYIDYEYPGENDYVGYYAMWYELLPRDVKAVTFTLKNTKELTAFRDYLEDRGYSQVGRIGHNRRVVVIQDKRLVETIQSLKNHIRLIDTIKPVMLILFGVIGFAVSYLLIKHRMSELGIMRSMGAKKRQVFLSYFLEQLILFFIGLIPAAVYAVAQPGKLILYGASLGYFILCYLIGTAFALIIMNRAQILNILFTKE